MLHHRFANATQAVWLCKSNRQKLENMKNEENNTRIPCGSSMWHRKWRDDRTLQIPRLPAMCYINVLYPVSHDVPYNLGVPSTLFLILEWCLEDSDQIVQSRRLSVLYLQALQSTTSPKKCDQGRPTYLDAKDLRDDYCWISSLHDRQVRTSRKLANLR